MNTNDLLFRISDALEHMTDKLERIANQLECMVDQHEKQLELSREHLRLAQENGSQKKAQKYLQEMFLNAMSPGDNPLDGDLKVE